MSVDVTILNTHTTVQTNLATSPTMEAGTANSTLRTNLCLNPNFETDTTSWVIEHSAILTRDTVSPISGTASAKLTNGGDVYTLIAVNAGDTLTVSLDYTTVGTITGTPQLYLSMPGAASQYTPLPLTQTAVGRYSVTSTAVTAGNAVFAVFAGTALTDVLHFDRVLAEKSAAARSYFDGSTTATADLSYAWTGTVNESTSTMKGTLVTGSSTVGSVISKATDQVHSGAASARVITDGAGAAEGWVTVAVSGTAHANVPITASIWVKATAGATLYFNIRLLDAVSYTEARTNFTGTGAWQRITVTHFGSPTGTSAQVHVRTQSTQATTFYVDDFTVTESTDVGLDFSGNTPAVAPYTYAWTGAANASTSTQTALLSTALNEVYSYSVVEDSTPVDPSSSSGGFGQVTITVPDFDGSDQVLGKTVTISDGAHGVTEGTIVTLGSDEFTLTITANAELGLLNTAVTAAPYSGTLGGYFAYLLSLVGITQGFQVDPAIAPATRTNLLSNPSGRRSTTSYSALNSTLGQDPARDTYARSTGSFGPGNMGVLIQTLTIGTNLAANTTYTVSSDIYGSSSTVGTKIYLTGAVSASSAAVTGTWGHASLTFTTPASGTVNVYVLNGTSVVSGDIIAFRDAKIEIGSVDGTYFDGTTPADGFLGYYWSGTVDGSPSTCEAARKAFPGWQANLWDQMKALCAGQQVEVTFVSDNIVMRPLRQNIAQTYRDESHQWALDTSSIAQSVSCYYYQGVQHASQVAYPLEGIAANTTVQSVDANQMLVTTLPLTPTGVNGTGPGVSLQSIQQPVCIDNMTTGYTGTSAYTVVGNDNNPYPAAKWLANGGSVTAAVGPDNASIIVTVTGCSDATLGPYRLAIADPNSPNLYHSSLYLIGSGVFYNKQLLTVPTGVGAQQTSNAATPTIDNFSISNPSEARSAAVAAASAATMTKTLSVGTNGINTFGDADAYTEMTMGQFDSHFAAGTFGNFDSQFPGYTFAQFDAWSGAQVSGQFANQAFGNVAGARVLYQNAWHRITSATITPFGLTYTAVADTTFADFDAIWAGQTFGAFDAVWQGRTFGQFTTGPLAIS